MDPKIIRQEFYAALATAAGVPRPPGLPRGLVLPFAQADVRVFVYAYDGGFNNPRLREPLPRICVEVGLEGGNPALELTVTLAELTAWAPWVVAWLKAGLANRPENVPAPPYPLDWHYPTSDLFSAGYLWSVAARREHRRLYREGRRYSPPTPCVR